MAQLLPACVQVAFFLEQVWDSVRECLGGGSCNELAEKAASSEGSVQVGQKPALTLALASDGRGGTFNNMGRGGMFHSFPHPAF